MATISQRAIQVAKTIHGNSPYTLAFPVGASQSFLRGEPVRLDSTGRVVVCSDNSAVVLGIAAEDCPVNSATPLITDIVHVWIADDETVFMANLAAGLSTRLVDVGKSCGLVQVGTSHVWVVNQTYSSRIVIIQEIYRGGTLMPTASASGDVQGQELFMFHPQVMQLLATS